MPKENSLPRRRPTRALLETNRPTRRKTCSFLQKILKVMLPLASIPPCAQSSQTQEVRTIISLNLSSPHQSPPNPPKSIPTETPCPSKSESSVQRPILNIPNTNPRPRRKHPRRNIHTHQLLKQQFRRIRNIDLRNLRLVVARSTLVLAFFDLPVKKNTR